MDKRLIIGFLKDKLSYTWVYFINTLCITLFFYIFSDKKLSIRYPIFLSIFIYTIYIIIELYRYFKFYKSIKTSVENPYTNIEDGSFKSQLTEEAIHNIHKKYLNKLTYLDFKHKESSKFLSMWAHSMKTPISVIELVLEKLYRKKLDESEHEELYLAIEEENNKLLNNLNNFLNLIRLDDFSKDFVLEKVELYSTLLKVINDKKLQFIHNNIFPKLLCKKEEYIVLSDSKWTKFIMDQIITNAIKYSSSDEKGKNIYFDILKEQDYVILSIRDEGMGIPDYDIKRIFEPFFTGENGRKIKNSTGIGLYICNIAAEKLRHEISIDSKVGEGSTVYIKYKLQ